MRELRSLCAFALRCTFFAVPFCVFLRCCFAWPFAMYKPLHTSGRTLSLLFLLSLKLTHHSLSRSLSLSHTLCALLLCCLCVIFSSFAHSQRLSYHLYHAVAFAVSPLQQQQQQQQWSALPLVVVPVLVASSALQHFTQPSKTKIVFRLSFSLRRSLRCSPSLSLSRSVSALPCAVRHSCFACCCCYCSCCCCFVNLSAIAMLLLTCCAEADANRAAVTAAAAAVSSLSVPLFPTFAGLLTFIFMFALCVSALEVFRIHLQIVRHNAAREDSAGGQAEGGGAYAQG